MAYFSIIIPTFNRETIIISAIEGVLDQTFDNWELLIVDDGSTDTTKENVEPYLKDKRINYVYQNNAGVCAARNMGAKFAKGQYLIFLDSDDKVESCWLEDFYNELKNNQIDIVYCSVKMQNPNGTTKLINVDNPYENGIGKGLDVAGSWALKREIFYEVGMYDETIKFSENNELRLRFNCRKLNIALVKKYNLIYFVSPDGGSKNYQNRIDSLLYILDKHKEYYTKNKRVKKLFLQVAAVSAARLGQSKKAHQLFGIVLSENKREIKLWVQWLITWSNFLTNLKWSKNNSN